MHREQNLGGRSFVPARPGRRKGQIAFARLMLEPLERRDLPSSANLSLTPEPSLPLQIAPSAQIMAPLTTPGITTVYTPAQIRAAYGFTNLTENGAGQTIAIVDAYNDPTVVNDLVHFDVNFGLPGQTTAAVNAFLTRVNENGKTAPLPAGNSSWAYEIALDVEWVHVIAPQAQILLVEASSSSGVDLLNAVNTARNTNGVSVVSLSWGSAEFAGETYYDSDFTTPAGHLTANGEPGGITFVASAGDTGAWSGPQWPSVSPSVLAVGGTTLATNGTESAWTDGGGGYSEYESEPSYQVGFNPIPMRSTPDVSYDANPAYGYYVYDTYALPSGDSGWWSIAGTSAGAPQWAGLIALANQARAANGLASLDGAQSALYTQTPASAFHDITTGSNGYWASVGYDVATGLGTPYADRIVNALSSDGDSTSLATLKAGKSTKLQSQIITAVGTTALDFTPGSSQTDNTENADVLDIWFSLPNSTLPIVIPASNVDTMAARIELAPSVSPSHSGDTQTNTGLGDERQWGDDLDSVGVTGLVEDKDVGIEDYTG